jgi:hypothetical protein
MEFIESSFVSKAELITADQLSKMVAQNTDNNQNTIDITNKNINYDDLDVKVFILSAKNKVDIVAKDFVKNYHNSLKIYQNDMGYFDQSLKIFKSKGDRRVYLQYNKIVEDNKNNKQFLQNILMPIPVVFKVNSVLNEKLQASFNIIKSLTLQRIYRNNYSRHCINKLAFSEEENNPNSLEKETKVQLCAILLENTHDVLINLFIIYTYQYIYRMKI